MRTVGLLVGLLWAWTSRCTTAPPDQGDPHALSVSDIPGERLIGEVESGRVKPSDVASSHQQSESPSKPASHQDQDQAPSFTSESTSQPDLDATLLESTTTSSLKRKTVTVTVESAAPSASSPSLAVSPSTFAVPTTSSVIDVAPVPAWTAGLDDPTDVSGSTAEVANTNLVVPLLFSHRVCSPYQTEEDGWAEWDTEFDIVGPADQVELIESVETVDRGGDADSDSDQAQDGDGDSSVPGSILSFEEWRKKKLAEAGQSPDAIRQARVGNPAERKKEKVKMDSFGEEGEIDLTFGRFGESEEVREDTDGADKSPVKDRNPGDVEDRPRRREAGTTSKARFNYASTECAATVLETNREAKNSGAVLTESKDNYMQNECSTGKYFVVELCDDILVDTVVLANLEFFSSNFRAFRVSVTDRYPVLKADRWKVLGTFEARNAREIQAFPVDIPLIWARYLRVDILSHYGGEFYCPITLLRLHGTTMMEEFRYQEAVARGEEEEVTEPEERARASQTVNPEPEITKIEPPAVEEVDDDIVTVPIPDQVVLLGDGLTNPDSEDDKLDGLDSIDVGDLIVSQGSRTPSQSSGSASSINPGTSSTGIPTGTSKSTPPTPTTQESFYKSIHKRLTALESNASLSLEYIEAQSHLLHSALANSARKQQRWTERLVSESAKRLKFDLGMTRSECSEVAASAASALSELQTRHAVDVVALSARLSIVADELVIQKRLAVVQSIVLLVVLGLVLFVRVGSGFPIGVTGLGLVVGGTGGTGTNVGGTPGRRFLTRFMSPSASPEPGPGVVADREMMVSPVYSPSPSPNREGDVTPPSEQDELDEPDDDLEHGVEDGQNEEEDVDARQDEEVDARQDEGQLDARQDEGQLDAQQETNGTAVEEDTNPTDWLDPVNSSNLDFEPGPGQMESSTDRPPSPQPDLTDNLPGLGIRVRSVNLTGTVSATMPRLDDNGGCEELDMIERESG